MDPIYVICHLCHASVGQPCRWGDAKYHDRRVRLAERGGFAGIGAGSGIDTEHALAHGAKCTGHSGDDKGWQDLCTVCGQRISRLKAIPKLLEQG